MAGGKRVEIVKITVDGPDGTPIEVDAKECTKCSEVKALTEFNAHKTCVGGREPQCKECKRRPGAKRIKPKTKWTTISFGEYVNSVTCGEYVLAGRYVGSGTHVEIRHGACGETYKVTPNKFLLGTRCPHCFGTPKKTTEQFRDEVHALTRGEYNVVGEYVNNKTYVDIHHNTCGKTYPVTPDKFLNCGNRCPSCFGSMKKTTEQFKLEVYSLVEDEYEVIGEYVRTDTHIDMLHKSCGGTYPVIPAAFLRGNRCPFCAESRGERAIRTYLTDHSYEFTPQFPLDDCRDINPLPFDFAVHFRDLDVLIEYDGRQHSEPVDFAGKGELWAREQFRDRRRKDRIKDDYCRANGIKLIRIKHTQFDGIEAILGRELSALGVTGKRPNGEQAEGSSAA